MCPLIIARLRQVAVSSFAISATFVVLQGLLLVPAANAQNNPFLIDGSVPANGGSPQEFDDPEGNAQELGAVNGNTTKVGVIHSDQPATLEFTNPNGQVDLRRVWIETKKDLQNEDIWLYFAWERDANSGSGFIAIEFQSAAAPSNCVYTGAGIDLVRPASEAEKVLIGTCNPWANRAPGDFLILWDQQGNTLELSDISKRTFEGSQNWVTGGPLVLGAPTEFEASNVFPAISPDGFYGELAINLTQEVFGGTNACVNFANIIPGTVTGNSDTADYKDTVLRDFPDISNCGTIVVKKLTNPADQSGTFPFTLDRADGSDIRFTGSDLKSQTGTLTEDGDYETYENLIVGTNYRLVEGSLTAPWIVDNVACVIKRPGGDVTVGPSTTATLTGIAVEAGVTTECTMTNRLNVGFLKVVKIVETNYGGGKTASDFRMQIAINGESTPSISFAGKADGETISNLVVGSTFVVSEETPPLPYAQESIVGSCSGTITYGDNGTCTITNKDSPASPAGVTVQKAILHDQLNITGLRRGGNETTWSATFRLYSDANCITKVGGDLVVGLPSTGSATSVSVNTHGTAGKEVNDDGTYRWKVEFSGNNYNSGFTTSCGTEITDVDFTHDFPTPK